MEQDEIDELVAAYDGADPFALPETVVVNPLSKQTHVRLSDIKREQQRVMAQGRARAAVVVAQIDGKIRAKVQAYVSTVAEQRGVRAKVSGIVEAESGWAGVLYRVMFEGKPEGCEAACGDLGVSTWNRRGEAFVHFTGPRLAEWLREAGLL